MEDKELKEKLGFVSFDVGIGGGKTQKHFLSPIVVKQILTIVKEAGYRKAPSGEPPVRKARHDWRWNSPSSGYRQCRKCGEIRTICHCKVEPCRGNQSEEVTPKEA